MPNTTRPTLVNLDLKQPIWDQFFTVTPLVVIGTREQDGSYNLAPKNMAMPLGWGNYFGFICTPSHNTYSNTRREKGFTVSFPTPDQVIFASLAAVPRCDRDNKPALAALPTIPSTTINGVFLKDAYLYLECELVKIVDGFDSNSLIAGKIVSARVREDALRSRDRDDSDLLAQAPLLAFLSPDHYSQIDRGFSFPFHTGFRH